MGLNGTSHSLPQSEQIVFVISLGPKDLGPPKRLPSIGLALAGCYAAHIIGGSRYMRFCAEGRDLYLGEALPDPPGPCGRVSPSGINGSSA